MTPLLVSVFDRARARDFPRRPRRCILGGATLGRPRYIWWNFVGSSRDRIEAAKAQWRKADSGRGLFDLPPDDRDEFTPLPPPVSSPRPLIDSRKNNAVSIEKRAAGTSRRYVGRIDGVAGEARTMPSLRVRRTRAREASFPQCVLATLSALSRLVL